MNTRTFLTLMSHLTRIGVRLVFTGHNKVALVSGEFSEDYDLVVARDTIILVDSYCKEPVLVARPGEIGSAYSDHLVKVSI